MRALSIKQSSCSGQRFIRGNQRSSEAIRGHQRSSEVIRGHQRSSEVIRSSSNLRRHSSLCFRFVNPDRPRRVARRYNLGDLIGD